MLGNAILKRVVAYYRNAPTGISPAHRSPQPLIEHFGFAIDRNAYCLKRLASGMPAMTSVARWNSIAYDVCQAKRGRYGLALPFCNDSTRNGASVSLVPVRP
jgi:hypothetical protein